ncbi:hypothetical protein ABO04_08295 [Nitrosomonas sp. HPC101]|nr:hypothetical protein [Nitrosomonas sp. HPC101]
MKSFCFLKEPHVFDLMTTLSNSTGSGHQFREADDSLFSGRAFYKARYIEVLTYVHGLSITECKQG